MVCKNPRDPPFAKALVFIDNFACLNQSINDSYLHHMSTIVSCCIFTTLLNKIPDMHYVKHKLVKNTLPSHTSNTTIPEYHPIVGEPRSK
jgi:hypothetical protein